MTLTLILGGARSGKTTLALALAEARTPGPVMIATAEALDAEMAERIARHRRERGPQWRTIEAPLDLAVAIEAFGEDEVAVVDCLTLWLSNLLHAERDLEAETVRLLAAMAGRTLILVSNEVGLGIVPENALARRFRDAQGRLNQRVAALCHQVVFVAAGLPLVLKGEIDDVSLGQAPGRADPATGAGASSDHQPPSDP
jgi:adenosylcobinamide kinase/adenosylcobinamide-phosphate guanylyltransferase